MSFTPEQWRAIAAREMAKKGNKKGRAYLHKLKLKAEHEGVPLIKRK